MDQKSDLIREDIDETRSQLTEKLGALEDQLRGTVETAKESVEETIENVKANLRRFTPSYQIEEHPLLCLGGVVAAGVLVGRKLNATPAEGAEPHPLASYPTGWQESDVPATSEYEDVMPPRNFSATPERGYGPSRPQAKPSLWHRFQDTFSDEIEMVKHMAMGAVLSSLRDAAKRSAPNLGSQIDQVMESAMRKFGVNPDEMMAEASEKGDASNTPPEQRYSPNREENLASKVV